MNPSLSHHSQHHEHHHSHGHIDPEIVTHDKGLWAVKWSFIGLMATALFQTAIVIASHSVALWADTIHNFADAGTSIPLGIAFLLGKRKPSKHFTYGYGRVEDLAGVAVLCAILFSALLAGYESIFRFFHPQNVRYLGAVMLASFISFLGNEAVAVFRIKVGKQIASVALVADGYHARTDGLTSLSVLVGMFGVWLGFPLADPIIGLLISIFLLRVVWDLGKSIFKRLLGGIEPQTIDEIRHVAKHVPGVVEVTEVRAKWIGHKLHAELNITVDSMLSLAEAHDLSKEVKHQLMHHIKPLSNAIIHIDPTTASGEVHHQITRHSHGDLPWHSH